MNSAEYGQARSRAPVWNRLGLFAKAACVGLLMLSSLAAHAGSVSYSYDALGRIAKVVYNNGTATTTINYSYDAAGNRTSVVTTSP